MRNQPRIMRIEDSHNTKLGCSTLMMKTQCSQCGHLMDTSLGQPTCGECGAELSAPPTQVLPQSPHHDSAFPPNLDPIANLQQLPPEAHLRPLFTFAAFALWILWIYLIGFWSSLTYVFGFSLWKRQVTLQSFSNSQFHDQDLEQFRTELRHLNSKLTMITIVQFLVLLLVAATIGRKW